MKPKTFSGDYKKIALVLIVLQLSFHSVNNILVDVYCNKLVLLFDTTLCLPVLSNTYEYDHNYFDAKEICTNVSNMSYSSIGSQTRTIQFAPNEIYQGWYVHDLMSRIDNYNTVNFINDTLTLSNEDVFTPKKYILCDYHGKLNQSLVIDFVNSNLVMFLYSKNVDVHNRNDYINSLTTDIGYSENATNAFVGYNTRAIKINTSQVVNGYKQLIKTNFVSPYNATKISTTYEILSNITEISTFNCAVVSMVCNYLTNQRYNYSLYYRDVEKSTTFTASNKQEFKIEYTEIFINNTRIEYLKNESFIETEINGTNSKIYSEEHAEKETYLSPTVNVSIMIDSYTNKTSNNSRFSIFNLTIIDIKQQKDSYLSSSNDTTCPIVTNTTIDSTIQTFNYINNTAYHLFQEITEEYSIMHLTTCNNATILANYENINSSNVISSNSSITRNPDRVIYFNHFLSQNVSVYIGEVSTTLVVYTKRKLTQNIYKFIIIYIYLVFNPEIYNNISITYTNQVLLTNRTRFKPFYDQETELYSKNTSTEITNNTLMTSNSFNKIQNSTSRYKVVNVTEDWLANKRIDSYEINFVRNMRDSKNRTEVKDTINEIFQSINTLNIMNCSGTECQQQLVNMTNDDFNYTTDIYRLSLRTTNKSISMINTIIEYLEINITNITTTNYVFNCLKIDDKTRFSYSLGYNYTNNAYGNYTQQLECLNDSIPKIINIYEKTNVTQETIPFKITTVATATVTSSTLESSTVASTIAASSTLASTIASSSTLASTIAASSTLASTIASSSTLASTIAASSTLASTIASSSTLASTIAASSTLASTIAASSILASTIASNSTLATTIASSSTLASTIAASSTLASTIASSSTLASTIAASSTLASTIASSSTLASTIAASSTLASTIAASSILASTIASNSTLATTIASSSTLASTTAASSTVASANVASSTVSSATVASLTLASTIAARSTLASTIAASSTVASTIAASSTLASTIAASSILASTIASNSTLASTIASSSTSASTTAASSTLASTIASSSTLASTIAASSTLASTIAASSILASTIASNSTLATTIASSSTLASTTAASSTVASANVASSTVSSATVASSTLASTIAARSTLASTIAASSTVASTIASNSTLASTIASSSTSASTTAASSTVASANVASSTVSSATVASSTLASTIAARSTLASTQLVSGEWSIWHSVHCVVQKSRRLNGSNITQLRNFTIFNFNLCDSLDPGFQKDQTEQYESVSRQKIDEIINKKNASVNAIAQKYSTQIKAKTSLMWVAIAFVSFIMISLLLNDSLRVIKYLKPKRKPINNFIMNSNNTKSRLSNYEDMFLELRRQDLNIAIKLKRLSLKQDKI